MLVNADRGQATARVAGGFAWPGRQGLGFSGNGKGSSPRPFAIATSRQAIMR